MSSSISSLHPLYIAMLARWKAARDAYDGEATVKSKRETYLPATSGMKFDGMSTNQPGLTAYNSYLLRSVFPEYMGDAVTTSTGVLLSSPINIELPAQLQFLIERASIDGSSLEELISRIQIELLITGRVGLLLDLPATESPIPTPYICLYKAENCINWDDSVAERGDGKLEIVVLDESRLVRDEFSWQQKKAHRVLMMRDGEYVQGLFLEEEFSEEEMAAPVIRGSTTDAIPFVFVGASSTKNDPGEIPLEPLVRSCYAIYRGEADYRQSLFMQGQDTLVISGHRVNGEEGDDTRTGAGAVLELIEGGTAEYIGVSSSGLSEQRTALENDRKLAESRAGRLLAGGEQAESGLALKMRRNAQTVSLRQISESSVEAVSKLLKHAAVWMGLDPASVVITQEIEVDRQEMAPSELLSLQQAKQLGAPLSRKTIHEMMKAKGMTSMEFDEEMSSMEDEGPVAGGFDGGN